MKTKINAKKLVKWVLLTFTGVALGLILFIRFSPYKLQTEFNKNAIKASVIINAPSHTVYNFMNESNNDGQWMLYVDHISVINKKLNNVSNTGTLMRFYCNNDETGQMYDGLVLKTIRNKKRTLKLYNFEDFPLQFEDIINEQVFKALPENKCELSLALFYAKTKPDFWDEVKAHIASYRIKKAMHENMERIKNEIENDVAYTKF